MQNPAQHSFITTSVLSGVSLRPQKSHQQMENQKSQSDPPKIIMPISIPSQPRDDDQPNEAVSTSDQSESDFLFRNIDDEMRSLEVLKNNLERILATVDRSSDRQDHRLSSFPKPANADRPVDPKKLHFHGLLVLEETCEPDVMIVCDPNGNRYSPAVKKLLNNLFDAVQGASPESLNSATNIPSDESSSPTNVDDKEEKEASSLTSSASSSSSVPEAADATNLPLKKIESINSRLVETQLELISRKGGKATGSKGGHVVVCTYKDSSLNAPLSIIPALKLRLFVPADYPMVSPIIFKKSSHSPRRRTNAEALHMKAHSRLSKRCHTLSEPISLDEIAKAWDASARAVLAEYACDLGLVGDEIFTSKNGT